MEENKKINMSLEPKNERKTSLQRLILTIVLILIVILGLYYTYQYYIKKAPNDDTNNTVELDAGWNGIYKKDESKNEILLYTADNANGSLILAQKLDVVGSTAIMYPMQFEGALTIKDGKMLYAEDKKTVFTIEKTENKVKITYNGDPTTADAYKELVGTYNKTKNITKFDTEEFE